MSPEQATEESFKAHGKKIARCREHEEWVAWLSDMAQQWHEQEMERRARPWWRKVLRLP